MVDFSYYIGFISEIVIANTQHEREGGGHSGQNNDKRVKHFFLKLNINAYARFISNVFVAIETVFLHFLVLFHLQNFGDEICTTKNNTWKILTDFCIFEK